MKRCRFCLLLLIPLLLLTGCRGNLPPNTVHSAEDMTGKTVGMLLDSTADIAVNSITGGDVTIKTYANQPELIAALLAGLVDCAIADADTASAMVSGQSNLKILNAHLAKESYGFIVTREHKVLIENMNEALASLKNSGKVSSVINTYQGGGIYNYTPTTDPATARGTLTMAVCPDLAPYQYQTDDGEWVGIDVTLAAMVCDYLNCSLELMEVNRANRLTLIEAGIYDFSAGGFSSLDDVTAKVELTDTYISTEQKIIVRR